LEENQAHDWLFVAYSLLADCGLIGVITLITVVTVVTSQ